MALVLAELYRFMLRGLMSFPGERDPACGFRAELRQVSYPRGTGTGLATWLAPWSCSGPTPVVLLAHGTAAPAPRVYAALIRTWLAAGWQVVIPELDGHGQAPPLAPGRAQETLPAVLAWLRAHARVRPDRIGLYGFSLGSALGLRAIADHPGTIAAAVLQALPPRIVVSPWDQLVEMITTFGPAGWPALAQGSPDHLFAPFLSEVRFADGRQATLLDHDLYRRIDAVVQAAGLREAAARAAATPLLLVSGAWDHAARAVDLADLHRAMPHATRQVLWGHNHFTPLFHGPTVAAQASFLARHLSP